MITKYLWQSLDFRSSMECPDMKVVIEFRTCSNSDNVNLYLKGIEYVMM